MCRHLEGEKIKFQDYLKYRYEGKPIYFYCGICNKMFIAKIRDRKVDVFIFTIIIFDFVLSILKNGLDLPALALFIIALLLSSLMLFLINFIEWKFIKYQEISIGYLQAEKN